MTEGEQAFLGAGGCHQAFRGPGTCACALLRRLALFGPNRSASCLCPFLSGRIPRLSSNAPLARASSCCSSTRLNFHCRNVGMIKVHIIFQLQPGLGSPSVQILVPLTICSWTETPIKSEKSWVVKDVPGMYVAHI